MKNQQKTETEKLCEYVAEKMYKHNIPTMLIAGDRIKRRSGAVMDSRKEMRDMNISILMDTMLNGEKTGELANVIMTTACILCATVPEWEQWFKELMLKYKQKQKAVTDNVANA